MLEASNTVKARYPTRTFGRLAVRSGYRRACLCKGRLLFVQSVGLPRMQRYGYRS